MWELDFHRDAANDAWDAGDYAQAAFHTRKALEIAPGSLADRVFVGGALLENREYEASQEALEQAIRLAIAEDDKEALYQAYCQLGIALMEMARYAEAERAFRESLTAFPGHRLESAVLGFLGMVQRRMGHDLDAERSLREALEMDPNYDEAMFNLAMLLEETDLRESVSLLQRALEIDPQDALAHRELGRLLAKQGDNAGGEAHLRRSAAIEDGDPMTHEYLGDLLSEQNRHEEAEIEWRRVAQLKPRSWKAYDRLADTYADQERWEGCEKALREVIRLAPNADAASRCETHRRLGIALMKLGRNAEAEGTFRESLAVLPGHEGEDSAFVLLGVVQGRQQRMREAERSFRKALEIAPRNSEAMYNLARSVEDSDPEEAVGLLRQVIEIEPRYAIAYRELGRLIAQRGDRAEGEALLRKAAAIGDKDPKTHKYLTQLFGEGGRGESTD